MPIPNYADASEFNHAVWPANTQMSFAQVPWDQNYRDIVQFDSRAALNTYLAASSGPSISLDKVTYHRPNTPIRLEVAMNEMLAYNYVRVHSPAQPVFGGDTARDFYYFVLDAEYVNASVTRLVLQLDIWQSYGFDASFGQCFIEQGHIGIANERNFDNYGRTYLTTPEGLNIGTDYRVVAKRTEKIINNLGSHNNYDVLIISTIDLTASDYGTVDAPILKTAPGGFMHGLPSGAAQYLVSKSDFSSLMIALADFPWIAQGIISITAVPNVGRYGYVTEATGTLGPTGVAYRTPGFAAVGSDFRKNHFVNWRNADEIVGKIPLRYRHLKKLLTSPYLMLELTTWSASPIAIKPEAWPDANATLIERANYLPPAQRVMIMPYRYNADPNHLPVDGVFVPELVGTAMPDGSVSDGWFFEGRHVDDDGGDFLDMFTQVGSFPSFALVNNGAISFMAANANSLAYSRESADWSQQVALRSSQTGFDQQAGAIDAARESSGITMRNNEFQNTNSNQNATTQSYLGVAGGVGNGAVSGAMAGGAKGAAIGAGMAAVGGIAGIAGTHLQNESNTRAMANNNAALLSQTANAVGQSTFVRDSNYALSQWSARGDYQNTLAGINAKVQDAQLTPPSTVGQVGGEAMNLVHGNFEYSLRWKMIDEAATAVVGEYWLRYGYAVRRFSQLPDNLNVMTHFTYWKLTETYLQATNIPESHKSSLRGIFEKGVTVWRTPDMIGRTDMGVNMPISGITL